MADFAAVDHAPLWRPERGIHAVQMELAIRGYMDEPDSPRPPTGRPPMTATRHPFATLQTILKPALAFAHPD
jgi:formiminoglutamase